MADELRCVREVAVSLGRWTGRWSVTQEFLAYAIIRRFPSHDHISEKLRCLIITRARKSE